MAKYNVEITWNSGAASVVQLDGATKLRANFTVEELANTKATDSVKLILNAEVMEFLDMIQEFRKWFNKSMTVSSFYRTASFNKSCGGSSNSLHLLALAMDWYIQGHTEQQRSNVKNKWEQICKAHGKIGGINYYTNGYHLDCAEDKFGYKTFQTRDYRGKTGDW